MYPNANEHSVFKDYTSTNVEIQPKSRKNFQSCRFAMTTDDLLKEDIQVPEQFSKTQVKRLKIILPFLLKKFGPKLIREQELYSVELKSIFGQKEMGEHLGKLLLIVVDNTWDYKTEGNTKCKTYRLNVVNYKKIVPMIYGSEEKVEDEVIGSIRNSLEDELKTGKFIYKDVDFRQYHPLISMPKEYRNKVLKEAGYVHEYDIASCAPTIIIERAKKSGVKIPFNKEVSLFQKNPKRYREYIAKRVGLPSKTIKLVINALIHGSKMSSRSEIFTDILNSSMPAFVRLAANPRFLKFRKSMGKILGGLSGEVENGDDMSFGKRTFMLYTEIESQIRKVWLDLANSLGAKVFLIHDGFNSDVSIDEGLIMNKIKEEIGYSVVIERGVL